MGHSEGGQRRRSPCRLFDPLQDACPVAVGQFFWKLFSFTEKSTHHIENI
jgi:hypothetical protein